MLQTYVQSHCQLRLYQIINLVLVINLLGCMTDQKKDDLEARQQVSQRPINRIFASTYVLKELAQLSLASSSNVVIEIIYPHSTQDPSLSVPDESMIKALQDASLIILNGARFEQGLVGIGLPRAKTLRTAQVFKQRWLTYPQTFISTHQHGVGGDHQHTGIDGHTWMDPQLLKKQYDEILTRLRLLDVELDTSSVNVVYSELSKLYIRWEEIGRKLRLYPLIGSHPAYQYLMRTLQVEMNHFNLNPDRLPNAKTLSKIEAFLSANQLDPTSSTRKQPLIWWESQPSKSVLEAYKEFKVKHVLIRPLERSPINSQGLFKEINIDLNALEELLHEEK
jgi:zinc transport system substrate-binding protein